MREIENSRKNKGVGVMTTKVQKWGNSLAIRIPKNIADQIDIDQGSELELHVQNNELTVRPKKKKRTLDELLSQVTDKNRHKEIDFGVEGNEIL